MAEISRIRQQQLLMYQLLGVSLIILGVIAFIYAALVRPSLFFLGLSLGTLLALAGVFILLAVDAIITRWRKR